MFDQQEPSPGYFSSKNLSGDTLFEFTTILAQLMNLAVVMSLSHYFQVEFNLRS